MLGAWMFETGRKKEGEHHYRRAIALFPYDPFMSYNLAVQYQMSGMYAAAVPLYRWTFDIAPRFRQGEGRENLALCLTYLNEVAPAREQAFLAMQYGGARLKDLRRIVQFSDSVLGKKPNAAIGAKRPSHSDAVRPSLHGNLPADSQITGVLRVTRN